MLLANPRSTKTKSISKLCIYTVLLLYLLGDLYQKINSQRGVYFTEDQVGHSLVITAII